MLSGYILGEHSEIIIKGVLLAVLICIGQGSAIRHRVRELEGVDIDVPIPNLKGFDSFTARENTQTKSVLEGDHSTQSAMKIFVSCGTLPLRLEAQTRRFPSEENMGKASKSG
jgi:hypothetical protein